MRGVVGDMKASNGGGKGGLSIGSRTGAVLEVAGAVVATGGRRSAAWYQTSYAEGWGERDPEKYPDMQSIWRCRFAG